MKKEFLQIKNFLNQDKVILLQSDTVPGLVCKANSIIAVNKIYQIKNRPKEKPFAIFASSIVMLESFLNLTFLEKFLFEKYLPGYFTFLINFNAKENIIKFFKPDALSLLLSLKNNKKTIGIRIPKDFEILNLINFCQFPLAATSANISGLDTPKKLEEVDFSVKEKVDFVWNKRSSSTENSTIIDISQIKQIEEEILIKEKKSNANLTKKEIYKLFYKNINIINSFLKANIIRQGSGVI